MMNKEQKDQYIRVLEVTDNDMKYAPETISHLKKEQLQELLTRYYDGERTSVLVTEYEIDCHPSRLYKSFPPVVTDTYCEYCEDPIVHNRRSRSNVNKAKGLYLERPKCNSCDHQPDKECYCSSCEAKRKEEAERKEKEKIRLIHEAYNLDKLKPIRLEDLNVKDRIYLASLLRMGLDVNLEKTEPQNRWIDKLSPSPDWDFEILGYLSDRDIIYPHPNSPMNAFDSDGDTPFPHIYYPFRVSYHINVDLFMEDRRKAIEVFSNPSPLDLINSTDDLYMLGDLWMKLAIHECEGYLELKLREVHLINDTMPVKNHIRSIFRDILEKLSTSRLYNLIYRGVKDGLHFKEAKGIRDPEIIVKYVVGCCRNNAERAIAEKWDIKPFGREFGFEQSVLGRLLYNRVFQIGEKAFDIPPNLEGLESVLNSIAESCGVIEEAAPVKEEETDKENS